MIQKLKQFKNQEICESSFQRLREMQRDLPALYFDDGNMKKDEVVVNSCGCHV